MEKACKKSAGEVKRGAVGKKEGLLQKKTVVTVL